MENITPKNRIVFPLDVPTLGRAVELTTILKDHVGVFKIGLELFTVAGPAVIEKVKKTAPETKIFLDLKLHDIPETVARAVRRVAGFGCVDFLTVHAIGGATMLSAAASERGDVNILGVTVLTSMGMEDVIEVGFDEKFETTEELVLSLAGLVRGAACQGVVSSPLEVAILRKEFGEDFLLITPGIRPANSSKSDDQKRVATPESAIKAGSDYLVVGRPIRDAQNPQKAALDIAASIESALIK